MKKFRLSLLSIVLCIVMVITNMSVVFAADSNGTSGEDSITTSNGIVNAISDDITTSSNGLNIDKNDLKMDLKDVDYNAIQKDAEASGVTFNKDLTAASLYTTITANINELNKEVRSDDLTVLKNGTLIDSSDDNFYIQGGSTYRQKFWWGIRQYKSTYYAGLWAGKLNQSAIHFGAAAGLTALFGFVPQAAACIGGAWYMGSIANKVNTINGSTRRGIRADIHWWLTYTIVRQ
ncbi:hypothetical protein [Clostridium psychrophilum]|uniref:hypothetical protein n=1 Tax=Clostridium psychrophilum TaxID=132926 RepID=UPI001C0AB0EB|nr:hypothetical protein [Clostridium psychrophilum]MBU3182881.1 hypothetical protein [Clostridium psychrophilum]